MELIRIRLELVGGAHGHCGWSTHAVCGLVVPASDITDVVRIHSHLHHLIGGYGVMDSGRVSKSRNQREMIAINNDMLAVSFLPKMSHTLVHCCQLPTKCAMEDLFIRSYLIRGKATTNDSNIRRWESPSDAALDDFFGVFAKNLNPFISKQSVSSNRFYSP